VPIKVNEGDTVHFFKKQDVMPNDSHSKLPNVDLVQNKYNPADTLTDKQKKLRDSIEDAEFRPEDSIRGIGIMEITGFDEKYWIYDSTGKIMLTIEHCESDSCNGVGVFYKNKKYRADTLEPQFFDFFDPREFVPNPDYFSLTMDCMKRTDKYYEVIYNKKKNLRGYIKIKDRSFRYETVAQFIEEHTGLGCDFNREENPLRKEPNDSSTVIKNLAGASKIWRAEGIMVNNRATVIMKGDWMNVEVYSGDYGEQGWIRWRKGNKILVRVYYAC
jgi:hypothetical protein